MKKTVSAFLATVLLLCAFPCLSAQAQDRRELLNSAELAPMRTSCTPLDARVDEIFAEILTDEMDTYDKVKACYTYLIVDSVYYQNMKWYDELYAIRDTYGYVSIDDAWLVYEASFFLEDKHGVCDDYAAAFTVMTRALGLESYFVWGVTNTTAGNYAGHAWVNIRIGDTFYHFDPQVEANIANRNDGVIGYHRFCATDEEMEGRLIIEDRDACVAAFGGFECEVVPKPEINGVQSGVSLPTDMELSFEIENIGNFAEGSTVELRYSADGGYYREDETLPCEGAVYENGVITWTASLVGEYTVYVVIREPNGTVSFAQYSYVLFDYTDSGTVGDMNGDGKVNAQDAALVLRLDVKLLLPVDWQLIAGDMNGDGKVNAQDASTILQYDVGLIPSASDSPDAH